MNQDATTLELPADREILIQRTFDAPARIVFEVLTRPEHVRRWWAPKSRGEMLVCEVDFRVGGNYRYVMKATNGFEVGFSGTFLEIESPLRVVQTEVFDPFPDAGSIVTMLLTEIDGKTRMTNRCVYPSKEIRDQVIATGMEDGMRESYRQLEDVIASVRSRS